MSQPSAPVVAQPGTDRRRGRRAFAAFLTSEVVSTTGTRMSMIAVPWFVLVTSGSPALTGAVAFAETLPYVLVVGLGGPIVDRFGARRVAVLSDAVAALLVGAIPVLHMTGHLPVPALVALVASLGLVRGAGAATHVLLPGVAELAGTPIERATGLGDGMNRVAGMVGVPLAGVLMAVWSAPAVLLIDAATFVVAGVLISLFVPRAAEPPRSERPEGASAVGHYVTELREGFAFLRSQRLLVAIAAMILVTNLLDQAYSAVLVPVWVRDTLDSPLGLGLIGGVFGVGAVAGSALFAWLGPRLPRRQSFAWGFLVGGSARFFVLALAVTLPPVLVVSFVAGLGVGAINPALASTEFELTPRHLQARVVGALGALAWAGIPLGALLGGLMVEAMGLTATLVVLGAAYLLATLAPFVFPVWRGMDRPPAADAADGSDGEQPGAADAPALDEEALEVRSVEESAGAAVSPRP
ncbi:MAG: MFS transporter [Frankiales bacterium]|nr:MFS transporter [Frankiales bacterium]